MSETDRSAPARVLIVAGSDSGGGAGIQADIKTVTALGGYAMTAITAITAQDTTGVHGVWPMPVNAVLRQVGTALADIGADVIKTGMMGDTSLVEQLAECLAQQAPDVPVVLDPVMVATSGDRLIDSATVSALSALMVPSAALVTPNAPEAEILTGKTVETVDGQRRAAERLLEAGAKAALVKGGHIEGLDITDVLQTQHGEWLFSDRRIDATSTHGTGCTLASACALGLGQGLAIQEAVAQARVYVRGAIANAPGFGQGAAPLHHGWILKNS